MPGAGFSVQVKEIDLLFFGDVVPLIPFVPTELAPLLFIYLHSAKKVPLMSLFLPAVIAEQW